MNDPTHLTPTFLVLSAILTFLASVLASSGFWMWVNKKSESKSLELELLKGIAYDRIICLGLTYISRGQVTGDEYEALHDMLYLPYLKLGGNGTAARVIKAVKELPIVEGNITTQAKIRYQDQAECCDKISDGSELAYVGKTADGESIFVLHRKKSNIITTEKE